MPEGTTKKAKLNKDKKAGASTQSCPLKENIKQPCDVGNLELIFVDSGGKTHKSVTKDNRSNRKKKIEPADFPLQDDQKYLNVANFDTVLEVIAPVIVSDATEKKKATFTSRVTEPIGTCPKLYHPKISMRISGPEHNDGLQNSQSWSNQSIMPFEVYGKSMSVDNRTSRIRLLDTLFFFENSHKPKHIKDIFVSAEGCGVRDDGTEPNIMLKGLIRVYREDKYQLDISIPSVISKGASFKKEVNAKGEVTKTQATWAGKTTNVEVYGKNGDLKGLAEIDEGHFTSKTDKINDKNEFSSKTKLKEFAKLTRNGRDLGALDTINKIMEVRKLIINGFNFIDELKNAVPQVGFGWSTKLDVLSGTVGGEWGIEAGTDHDTEAYKFVGPYGQINLSLALIKFEFEASFGIECKSPSILNWFKNPAYEVIAKVAFKVDLDCKAETDIKLVGKDSTDKVPKIGKEGSSNDSDFEKVLWTNSVTGKAELYGQFKVNVYGYGMDAKSGVVGSVTAEFKVVKPFKIRGSAKRGKGYVYAYFVHTKKKKSPPWEFELYPEKILMKEKYLIQ